MAQLIGAPASRDRRAAIGTGAALLAATAYVGIVDPTHTHAGPPCPLHALTGWWCPVCGTTRAVHALLHGDVAKAFGFNVLFPVYLLAIGGAWLAWMRRADGRAERGPMSPPRQALWLAGAAMVVFTIVRNLPAGRALAP